MHISTGIVAYAKKIVMCNLNKYIDSCPNTEAINKPLENIIVPI